MDSTTYTKIFTRGNKAQMPSASDGIWRLATDAEELFIDVGQSHVQITDFVKGYTTTQILAIQSPLDKIYLSSDTLNLYYYDTTETEWVNLSSNHTHTTTDITDLATASFVTVQNIDTTEGLDFGDEDEDEEESV